MAPKDEIDALIASQPNWKGELLAEIRNVLISPPLELEEQVKWKMPSKPLGSPTWESNGIVCVSDYLKNAVRLTFPKGASVQDPQGLFNARLDSKTVRAIDFAEGSALNHEALRSLAIAAVALNQ
jgi:hypothetical protein